MIDYLFVKLTGEGKGGDFNFLRCTECFSILFSEVGHIWHNFCFAYLLFYKKLFSMEFVKGIVCIATVCHDHSSLSILSKH